MPEVYASIGSNIDREHNIRSAISVLKQHFGQILLSSVYQSRAVGFDGDDFLNLVISFESDLPPAIIQQRFRDIEAEHGRQRGGKAFAPRSLDIDLLLYDDLILNNGELRLPRDEIQKYAFVLGPLAEISPQRTHPETGTTYAQMWREFSGPKEISKIEFEY
ncbi:MAG: 2-amino-4-hydroxy-6-hydroxymethyldihydropteridine diphosphokinase [Gammaproteobacteria bacterium]|nr:MAG: 2-amino-4-hydroxy-6-hydroxymethyldihydropteridine diphosphokinase [Gammaproteobacteria bacterium]